jgi:CelD/BcsL family acetyltransferase involved in cellulose biosynthesis
MSASPASSRTPAAAATVCPACRLPLLQPQRWERAGRLWRVRLWCPSCDWHAGAWLDEPAVERLEVELERGQDEIALALMLVTASNMRQYAARFAAALAADALLPEDF